MVSHNTVWSSKVAKNLLTVAITVPGRYAHVAPGCHGARPFLAQVEEADGLDVQVAVQGVGLGGHGHAVQEAGQHRVAGGDGGGGGRGGGAGGRGGSLGLLGFGRVAVGARRQLGRGGAVVDVCDRPGLTGRVPRRSVEIKTVSKRISNLAVGSFWFSKGR